MKRQDLFWLGCFLLVCGVICALAQFAAGLTGIVPGVLLILFSLRIPHTVSKPKSGDGPGSPSRTI